MKCPKCGQEMRREGAMEDAEHAARHGLGHGVQHAMRGDPFLLLASGGYWLAARAVNWLSVGWRCKCGHTCS